MTQIAEKRRARKRVRRAVEAGRLTKADACEGCGRVTNLHGHHPDYSRPLEVEWLCPLCHAARHPSSNSRGNPRLSQEDVDAIRRSDRSTAELAEDFSVNVTTIRRIIARRTWR